MVTSGAGEYIDEGLYEINLTVSETSQLVTGSNQLLVVVVPIPVSMPTSVTTNFISTP